MIKIIEGNLLDATEDIMAHQVNCMGKYNAGIAKQIRERFPNAYDSYIRLYQKAVDKKELLGHCNIVTCPNGIDEVGRPLERKIANLFGQYTYGSDKNKVYTDYEELHIALIKLEFTARFRGCSVALPWLLGCGLANGDWDVVYGLIEDVFSESEVTLYRLQ